MRRQYFTHCVERGLDAWLEARSALLQRRGKLSVEASARTTDAQTTGQLTRDAIVERQLRSGERLDKCGVGRKRSRRETRDQSETRHFRRVKLSLDVNAPTRRASQRAAWRVFWRGWDLLL